MAGRVTENHLADRCLIWHRAQNYSFFLPDDWYVLSWLDDPECEIYGPDPNDPFTVYGVDRQDLGTSVNVDNLDILAEGFFDGIELLPESNIELRNKKVVGNLLELEAKYTFSDEGNIRNRWVRVFYHETYQITMTAQGATLEKYDYWLPLFFEMMITVRIHNHKAQSTSLAADQAHKCEAKSIQRSVHSCSEKFGAGYENTHSYICAKRS